MQIKGYLVIFVVYIYDYFSALCKNKCCNVVIVCFIPYNFIALILFAINYH